MNLDYVLNENEIQISLEIRKLANFEEMLIFHELEAKIPGHVADNIMNNIRGNIIDLLHKDTSPIAETVFLNECEKYLKTPMFMMSAKVCLKLYKLQVMYQRMEQDRILATMPVPNVKIMDYLVDYGNNINDVLGRDFDSQNFLSQFLVYKTSEDRLKIAPKRINKRELYDMVYEPGRAKTEIFDKITLIQNKHKSIFKGKATFVNYDTAKKRMQQVIPSKHKEGTMDQSEKLNVFQQHALLMEFLIYKTSYQRFLSNPSTQNVPGSGTFKEMKEILQEFLREEPISGINDELFLKTVIEDTYHFALFNAMTRLTTVVLKTINEIIEAARQYDSLSMLFVINQMIENTPTYTAEWIQKYKEMVDEIDKLAKIPEIEQAVLDAVDDEAALEYAKQTMLNMFSKFDNLQQDSENYDFMEDTFKKIVKDFYNDDEAKNAYSK